MASNGTYALAFGLMAASGAQALPQAVKAPCVYVGGNTILPLVDSEVQHTSPVYFHHVDDARVFWYAQTEKTDRPFPIVLVVQHCLTSQDLTIYPKGEDTAFLSTRLVRDLLVSPKPLETEELVDHMADIGVTWTRDAAKGSCVCDLAHTNRGGAH